MTDPSLPLAVLLLPLMAALWLWLAPPRARVRCAWVAGAALLGVLALLLACLPEVLAGGVWRWSRPWLPDLGLNFSLRIDALAWLFAALISGIGGLVVLYAHYYLDASEAASRLYAGLMLFAGTMLGVVIAGNLLLLAIFWELTSLSSFLLVGHWHQQADARRGARMALTLTGLGGLALLAGVLLIGKVVGSLELDVVLAAGDQVRASPLYPLILGLILLGAFTKSAQFPFHFWLPHAMAAPTPVSAYLHSATLVKAGVFLLARLYPLLSGTDLWLWSVGGVGLITLLLGSAVAIFQHDLKGLLAYSTLSHLGLITLLLGLESPLTVVAALFHVINHATFKASLFMAAGIIDHETGTRDMRRLHGLMRYLPWTGALAISASAAMAGVPLLNGFLSKEMFFAETLRTAASGGLALLVPAGALLAGVFAVAYSSRLVHDVFFGRALVPLAQVPHEPPRWMKLPVEVLVLLCVAVGIFPAITVGPLLHAASTASLGTAPPPYSLALWHGFNGPLAMSALAFVAGLALYFLLYRRLPLHAWQPRPLARALYDRTLRALLTAAAGISAAVNPGRLQPDLRVLLALVVALGVWAGASANGIWGELPATDAPVVGVLLWIILIGLLAGLLRLRHQRFSALLVLGGIGLLVMLSFALLSAPDLALTQLLVEAGSVLVLLLVLPHLPDTAPPEAPSGRRWIDGLIALAAGCGMTVLTLAMLSHSPQSISDYFLAQALPGAGGLNVVNVIIVDFRGLDTLGEMTVFAVAALAIHALLSGLPVGGDANADSETGHPATIAHGAGLLLPVALLVALYLLIRGHNAPGGGFIAGLVVAVVLALQRLTKGQSADPAASAQLAVRVVAAGLALAALTALASSVWGYPLLTSYYGYWELPLVGKLPIASVFLFDTGVFLVVAAGTLLALESLARIAHLAERRPWNG